MSKLIVVIGATGGQGGGVVDRFSKDPAWRVRGVTRNLSGEKAKALISKGVEMVQANTDDEESLVRAFQGANAIFAFTDYYDHFFDHGAAVSMKLEGAQAINLAKAAAKTSTLEHYIWSTLPLTSALSNGKAVVPHFEGKASADVYIKEHLPELLAKTTFTIFTIFAANMHLYPIFRPIWIESAKKWIQLYPTSPLSPYLSVGDHRRNSGVFVHSIISNPPPGGSYVKCNVDILTMDSYLALWGKASSISPEPGSTAVLQVSFEQYVQLWGPMGEEQASQWKFFSLMVELGLGLDKIPGTKFLDAQELMTAESIGELVSTEESLKAMDWTGFGYPVKANGVSKM